MPVTVRRIRADWRTGRSSVIERPPEQQAAGSWQPTARCPLPAESVRGHVWHAVKSERVAFVVEQPDIRLPVTVEHQADRADGNARNDPRLRPSLHAKAVGGLKSVFDVDGF